MDSHDDVDYLLADARRTLDRILVVRTDHIIAARLNRKLRFKILSSVFWPLMTFPDQIKNGLIAKSLPIWIIP